MKTIIDKYPEFTETALGAGWTRTYRVYYRAKGMEKSAYFHLSTKDHVNDDPTKPIVPRPDRARCHVGIEDLCKRFRLINEFLLNDQNLKVIIIDTRGAHYPREVMAVGENGKWKIRENYKALLERFLIGNLPNNITFVKAA